jgi:hypothetical protein
MTVCTRLSLCLAFLLLPACGEGSVDLGEDNPTLGPEASPFDPNGSVPNVPMCSDTLLTPEITVPNLLLVVDRSGSMKDPISATSVRRKIDDTRDALHRLVEQGDGSIAFGLQPFPASGSCGAGLVTVGCDLDATTEIGTRVDQLEPSGGTPTGPTLEAAFDYAPLHSESSPSFVVLLTDGKPTCPSGDGSTETAADQQAAIAATAALHAAAIDTFVVGIGEDLNASNPTVLNEMAVAGGRPRPGGVKYYQANSLAEIDAALDDITAAVFGCTFTLSPAPEDPALLWVTFDDRVVLRDPAHANGWDYDAHLNQVTAYGPACGLLQGGRVGAVEIYAGCAAETFPEM